jgi:hypothetical protein
MAKVIDETYLPFSADKLRQHFVADVDRNLRYYERSAKRYHEFMAAHPITAGISIKESRVSRQIEKDEKFWTLAALKGVFDDPSRDLFFEQLLRKAHGDAPPINGMNNWTEWLDGELRLYFEACLPSPSIYVDWLRENLSERQMIPYVLDAALRESTRTLEGATHVDALLINLSNGFAWLIEAKVLSDLSCSTSFDSFRNQIARNIDVMLENNSMSEGGLDKRDPDRTLFALLTPASFKECPHSRLYGWLMQDYQTNPAALQRDLRHRTRVDWAAVSRRVGWFTFEDIENVRPGTCAWLDRRGNTGAT